MTVRARHVLLVAAIAVVVNIGALRPGFIHDDHRIIEQNDLTAGLGRLPQIFRSGYWSTGETQVPNLYRPLTILSFAFDRTLHDLRPFGFRLVDLALHALNAVLVLLLGWRLFPRPAPGAAAPGAGPLAAALVFAVHPVHTEALGEIVGRAELLAAAFGLGSLVVFLRARLVGQARPSARTALLALSLVLFVLGFLSKENAVVVPGLLLLADLLVVRRPAWGFHGASLALLVAVLSLRIGVLGGLNPAGPIHFVDNPIASLPFLQGRLTALAVLARYAWLLVWPARLSIDYSFRTIAPATGLLDPRALAGVVCLAVWAFLLVRTWRRTPGAAFALAFGGAAMAPVANLFFPIGTIMAERLLYLPSAGFCLASAALAWSSPAATAPAPKAPPTRAAGRARTAQALAVVLVAALALRSFVRLRDWRDDHTIFEAALRVAPDSVRALFNFGATCEEKGDDPAAIDAYRKALGVWPDFASAHYNLAGVLARQKSWSPAVDHYREAVRLEPGNVQYLANLAHALEALDRHAEARELLQRAIGLDPRSTVAYTNLGAVELASGNTQAAIAAYLEAARLEPSNADYLRNLGVAQLDAHDAGAASTLRRALALRPGDPDLLDALGLALLDAGDAAAAEEALRQGVAARPAHPVYRYHLARALEQSGRGEQAETQYREAIRLAPSAPAPLKGLGMLLAKRGDRAGARDALERAEALDTRGNVMDPAARALLADLRRAEGGMRRR